MSQHNPNFRPGLDAQGFPLKPKKKRTGLKILAAVVAVFFVTGTIAAVVGGGEASVPQSTLPNVVTSKAADKPAAKPTVKKPAAPATTEAPQAEPTKPSMTKSQEQAIGSAESYLELTAFSRKGLIRQLSSSPVGFSKADATFAVDHIEVDWNEQAAKSAKSYLELTNFSRAGLIQQLSSDAVGFTKAQAVYGVNKAGL